MTHSLNLRASGVNSADDDISEEDEDEDDENATATTAAAGPAAAALAARRAPGAAAASSGSNPHALPQPAHPIAPAAAKADSMPVPPPRLRRQTLTEEGAGAPETPRTRAETSVRPPAIEMEKEPPSRVGARPMLSPTNPFLDAPLARAGGDRDDFSAIWKEGPMDSEA